MDDLLVEGPSDREGPGSILSRVAFPTRGDGSDAGAFSELSTSIDQ